MNRIQHKLYIYIKYTQKNIYFREIYIEIETGVTHEHHRKICATEVVGIIDYFGQLKNHKRKSHTYTSPF